VKAEGAISIANHPHPRQRRDELLAPRCRFTSLLQTKKIWRRRVKDITCGAGARVIFDAIGGPLVDKLAEVAAPGATIFLYGVLSGTPDNIFSRTCAPKSS